MGNMRDVLGRALSSIIEGFMIIRTVVGSEAAKEVLHAIAEDAFKPNIEAIEDKLKDEA